MANVAQHGGVKVADEPSSSLGYEPGPGFQRVDLSQPKLDCSDAGLDGDKELWLLQLPHNFPVGANVTWQVADDPVDGFRGRCSVKGVEYVLVPEGEALSAELFATPPGEHGALVPVTRRLTVAATSAAPHVCFGRQQMDVDDVVLSTAQLPSPDKKALKKKRKELQQPTAPGEVAAAGAAAAQQQQQQQADGEGGQPASAKKQKKKGKREAEAAEAASGEKGSKKGKAVAAAAEAAAAAQQQQPEKKSSKQGKAAEAAAPVAALQQPEKKSSKQGMAAAAEEAPAAVPQQPEKKKEKKDKLSKKEKRAKQKKGSD